MAPSRVVFSNGLEQPGIHPVCDQMMPKYTYGYRLDQIKLSILSPSLTRKKRSTRNKIINFHNNLPVRNFALTNYSV